MTRLVHVKQILILLIALNFTVFTVCNSQDKRTIKVGLGQMKVVDGEVETNLKTAGEMIKKAKEQFADIVVLPECSDIGWGHVDALELAKKYGKTTQKTLCKYAKKNSIFVVVGITEYENSKVYNTALTIDPKGNIINKHRKINTLTSVEPMYEIGDRISVFQTPWAKVGVSICADNFSSSTSIAESLIRMGAEIILSPCAWAVSPDFGDRVYGNEWRRPYSYLAKNFGVPVVGVSYVGKSETGAWKGHSVIGNSIWADCDGNTYNLPFGENAECFKVVELTINTQPLKGTSLTNFINQKKQKGE